MLKSVVYVFAVAVLISGCSDRGKNSEPKSAPLIRVAKKARKTGNPDAAISFYNKALEIDPNNAEAYLGLAEAYIDTNLLDAAIGYIKKAENCNCDVSRSSYLSGKVMLLSGNSAKAEKEFLKSLSADSLNALGTIYDERGDHEKAQAAYRRVIHIDPNYIDAYNNLGLSLLLSEDYSKAIKYLENACALPEADVAYRSNLALAYGLSGDVDKAREIYALDFEGDDLDERVSYIEDLLLSKHKEK